MPSNALALRSEERRVGKEWELEGSSDHEEDGIRDKLVTGVQTCALPISDREFGGIDAARREGMAHLRARRGSAVIEIPGVGYRIAVGVVRSEPCKQYRHRSYAIQCTGAEIGRASCRERVGIGGVV